MYLFLQAKIIFGRGSTELVRICR